MSPIGKNLISGSVVKVRVRVKVRQVEVMVKFTQSHCGGLSFLLGAKNMSNVNHKIL